MIGKATLSQTTLSIINRVQQKKFTRIHYVSIALGFFVLLSIGLIISLIVQTRKNDDKTTGNDYCLTEGCLSAASHQLRSMDQQASSNLCTDFYSYACGNWQRTHPILSSDIERTILSDILYRREFDIQRLLESPIIRSSPTSWEYKVKTYYAECRDDYSRQSDSAKYMITLIEDQATIGGWFILDNSAENASQTDLLRNQSVYTQMSHIHGDLGVLAVFGIRSKFNESNPNTKQLEFYPAGLSMEVNDYLGNDSLSENRRAIYQAFILQVMSLLTRDAGVTDENVGDRALTVANDVFSVELFLAQSMKSSTNNDQPAIFTLEDMSAEFSFDFLSLMNHELGDPTIVSRTTLVYVSGLSYFTNAFEYLNNDGDPLFARLVHNYLRWRLILTYIDDLSYDYLHAHRIFLDGYYGASFHSSNEEYCATEVIRRFPMAIQRLSTRNSTIDPDQIQPIFDALKQGFIQYIDEQADWISDQTTKTIAKDKILSLTDAIGYASIASNDDKLDDYYSQLFVDDSSHLQNSYMYHRFSHWALSNSIKVPDALEHWDLFESKTSRLFDYIAFFNRLFVVASALTEPLFDPKWPNAVNMGSIGVLLAQKLFASIDFPEGRNYFANGTRVSSWWSSSTLNSYNTSRNCITDYYVQDLKSVTYNVNGLSVRVDLRGEPFSSVTFRHIGALRLAYNALKKIDSSKTFKMPGTDFNREQTFFLAYGQTQCFQRQGLAQVLSTRLGVYDEQTALNAALFQMADFRKAFNCPMRSKTCV